MCKSFLQRGNSLLLFVCLVSLFLAGSGEANLSKAAPTATDIWTDITADTTWTLSGSPYYIRAQEITIQPGVTLTIEPGVSVYLSTGGRIHVSNGSAIIAKGTPTQNIVFDRDPANPTYTWKNIRHYPGSTSYYRYVRFSYGGNTEGSLYYSGGTHVLNNCEVRSNKRQGIIATGSTVDLRIAGTLFEDTKLRTLYVSEGAKVTVTGSTFNDRPGDWSIYVSSYTPIPTVSVTGTNFLRDYGIFNELAGSMTINAENNWWGAASGPSGSGPGSGAIVSGGVDFNPWVTTGQVARVGITTPPTAAFTTTPDPSVARPTGTVYTFGASGSTDVEDYTSSLDFCWNWEDDGIGCNATVMTSTHSYASGGWHTARLTITDTDGMTDTLTQNILSGWPPTATLVITQTGWADFEFDTAGSDDVEDDPADLQVRWDWEGDGVWDTGVYSVTDVVTHTYDHVGRYWPTVLVEDTDSVTSTLSKPVDVIPPATPSPPVSGGGMLVSTDGTVTVTWASGVISDGVVITHTAWLTVPVGGESLPGEFTYQGFTLEATFGGQPVAQTNGAYTITVSYDLDYYSDVLGLWTSADLLRLYQWSETSGEWVLVPFTIDSGQLIATTDSFGHFALVLESTKTYLPLVFNAH